MLEVPPAELEPVKGGYISLAHFFGVFLRPKDALIPHRHLLAVLRIGAAVAPFSFLANESALKDPPCNVKKKEK